MTEETSKKMHDLSEELKSSIESYCKYRTLDDINRVLYITLQLQELHHNECERIKQLDKGVSESVSQYNTSMRNLKNKQKGKSDESE